MSTGKKRDGGDVYTTVQRYLKPPSITFVFMAAMDVLDTFIFLSTLLIAF